MIIYSRDGCHDVRHCAISNCPEVPLEVSYALVYNKVQYNILQCKVTAGEVLQKCSTYMNMQ